MGEFDELVSRQGVLVAGRLGPDWRVAEHKSTSLFIDGQTDYIRSIDELLDLLRHPARGQLAKQFLPRGARC